MVASVPLLTLVVPFVVVVPDAATDPWFDNAVAVVLAAPPEEPSLIYNLEVSIAYLTGYLESCNIVRELNIPEHVSRPQIWINKGNMDSEKTY